jgi:hypothetical protein
MLRTIGMCGAALMALIVTAASGALAADGGVWSVSKSSGEVWITATGAQPASLSQEDSLKPGDMIRTGRNGRVLLVRGEETILIAPNSVIGVPTENKDGMSTTIQQRAGSILLEVEKRNVKHFEVETPYLAAVVKGTQFSVTIDGASTRVAVDRGQVEVADFKSGQIAQVLPGQAATSFVNGKPGLSLSGSGSFNPIEQGKPRASSIDRVPVPKGGLQAPRNAGDGKTIHAVAGSAGKDSKAASGKPAANPISREAKVDGGNKRGVIRISSALGEVKLNVNKATHGLAHGSAAAPGLTRNASREPSNETTIWSDSKPGVTTAYASSQPGSGGAAAAAGSSASAAATSAATAAAVDSGSASDPGNNGNGNGNGNANGNNGNGNGNAATGSGKIARIVNGVTGVLGVGNNGNGNGNGNGGVGNGNGKGNAKH